MKIIQLKKTFLFLVACSTFQIVLAQPFIEVPTVFDDVFISSIAYSDVDGDNDIDVFIVGSTTSSPFLIPTAKLYINDGTGTYSQQIGTSFEGVITGSAVFSDIDGDNDQDLLVTGFIEPFVNSLKLYRNDGSGNFTEILDPDILPVFESAVAFVDIDGDNDQDLFILGKDEYINSTSIMYLNDGLGNFTEMTNTPFELLEYPAVAFADIDGDNDQDLLMAGQFPIAGGSQSTKLYKNDGLGNYTEVMETPFDALADAEFNFFDADGDDDLDLMMTGWVMDSPRVAKLFSNDGLGNFLEVTGTPFVGVSEGSLAVDDVDNDNDQDILITGINSDYKAIPPQYFINDGLGNFTELMDTPFVVAAEGASAFVDVDGDGDQDILITGRTEQEPPITKLYLNQGELTSVQSASSPLSFEFSIYPIPANLDLVYVDFYSEKSSLTTINVIDINGRILSQQNKHLGIGQQNFSIDISTLAVGSYAVQLIQGTKNSTQKFIIR